MTNGRMKRGAWHPVTSNGPNGSLFAGSAVSAYEIQFKTRRAAPARGGAGDVACHRRQPWLEQDQCSGVEKGPGDGAGISGVSEAIFAGRGFFERGAAGSWSPGRRLVPVPQETN